MKGFRIRVLTGVAAVCAAIFWPGCEKVDTNLTYTVVPYLSLPDVDTVIQYVEYVDVFYHIGADTLDWWVTSYEDACEGVITDRDNGEKLAPDANNRGYLNADGTALLVGPFYGGPVLLVAYDRERHGKYESKMYAWRNIQVEPGIESVRIPVIFNPEPTSRTYIDPDRNPDSRWSEYSRWWLANDNPWVEPQDEDDGNDGGDSGEGSDAGGGR